MTSHTHLIREILTLYLSLSAALISLGVLSLDLWLTLSGILPLCMLITGYMLPEPDVEVRLYVHENLIVGERTQIKLRVVSVSGIGSFILVVTLPACFRLEKGGKKVVLWGFKLLTPYVSEETLNVRVCKSGKYNIVHIRMFLFNALLVKYREIELNVQINVNVRPRVYLKGSATARIGIKRVGTGGSARALLGPLSLEFKEIRRYVPGDPPKLINWKVTARLGSDWPYVNEVEREATGKIMLVPLFNFDLDLEDEPVGEAALSLLLSIGFLLCREGYLVYFPVREGFRRLQRVEDLIEVSGGLKDFSRLVEEDFERAVQILEKCALKVKPDIALAVACVREQRHADTINRVVEVLRKAKLRVRILLLDVSNTPRSSMEELKLLYAVAKKRLLRSVKHYENLIVLEAPDITLQRVPIYMSAVRSMLRTCR